MKPKEKAEELVLKYLKVDTNTKEWFNTHIAKQCALLAVDEIIKSSPSLPILGDGGTFGEDIELSKKYWQEVKQEINNL
jgi:hypothetical protein